MFSPNDFSFPRNSSFHSPSLVLFVVSFPEIQELFLMVFVGKEVFFVQFKDEMDVNSSKHDTFCKCF